MTLPAGFLDELRTRLSLTQVVGRKVIWDRRKSNPGKGDMWAPCPFHQEKSASFHVDDRKGFYYCFGCHAKGDAISFVRETENVGFGEAIEILAREAGMTVPARDPRAQERSDKRTELVDVMEAAVQFYRLQLKTQAAESARAYLLKRGLSPEAWDRWHLGFAPDNRQALLHHLTGKGIDPKMIEEAGLAARPEDGGAPYDRFRGRIIFPIRDARGRAISLGGRAMDPNARAKYLNGPETALFDKGRNLYNHGPAREAAGKGAPLIVAEGYMDVIALSEAGFKAAVAPLGTAVTADQLQLMWRISPEPIIALDGDKAGLRAAERVVDLALPLLEAGKALRFAILPEGTDPDDLIKAKGASAMQATLEGAVPMVSLLWRRETQGRIFDSPERRAALDKVLRDAVRLIKDPSVRGHYGEEINRLRQELFGTVVKRWQGPRKGEGWTGGGAGQWRGARQAPPMATQAARASSLAQGRNEDYLREQVILATLLRNPALIGEFNSGLWEMDLSDPLHQRLRDGLLRHARAEGLYEALAAEIGALPLESLLAERHVAISPGVRRAGNLDVARACLLEELSKLSARRGHAREIEEAIEDWEARPAEAITFRLGQAAKALDSAGRGDEEDTAEYETGPNGARLRRDERDAFDELLAQIGFKKSP